MLRGRGRPGATPPRRRRRFRATRSAATRAVNAPARSAKWARVRRAASESRRVVLRNRASTVSSATVAKTTASRLIRYGTAMTLTRLVQGR